MTYSVTVGGDNPLYDLQVQDGLNQPAFGFNFNKNNERYFQSTNGSNPANSGYYVLYQNKLYTWDGAIGTTLVPSQQVFDFTPYGNVSANPALLSSAYPAIPTVAANAGLLYRVKEQFGLGTPDFGFDFNHADERIFLSGNNSNALNGGYYVLMPTGLLYAWQGSLATTLASAPVADLSALGVYADPSLLRTMRLQGAARDQRSDLRNQGAVRPDQSELRHKFCQYGTKRDVLPEHQRQQFRQQRLLRTVQRQASDLRWA